MASTLPQEPNSSGSGGQCPPCPWANVPVLGGLYCQGWQIGCNANGTIGTITDPGQLVQLFMADIAGIALMPFKALGLNSLRDGLYRGLFVLLGIMAIGMGLLLFAGVAIKEEAGSPAGQQVEGAAPALAMAA